MRRAKSSRVEGGMGMGMGMEWNGMRWDGWVCLLTYLPSGEVSIYLSICLGGRYIYVCVCVHDIMNK